jgi:DNA-binding CsgD family transcriptional regulator
VIARLGQIEMWAAEVTPGLLERGAELELRHGLRLDYVTSPRFWLARLRVRQGRLEEADAMFATLAAEASARGDEHTSIHTLWYRSMIDWMRGNWHRALELAKEAHETGEQTHFPNARGWNGRVTALIEADLGLVEQARASAHEGMAQSEAVGNEAFRLLCLGVLGRLEWASGDVRAAGGYLRELPERLLASGMNDPTQPIWADAIETLIALGELGVAGGYLEAYEQSSRRSGSPWAAVCALRCRAVLAAAERDLASAFEAYDRTLALLEEHPFPFERGRTLLYLGGVRRQAQQKKAARDALDQALAVFEELGARLWAEKTRVELARISGRRATDDDLTETEKRVAGLAAEGRTNKEIAATLFMGVSTVEAHLSHVYRKLGIHSRAALGPRLETAAKPMERTPQT